MNSFRRAVSRLISTPLPSSSRSNHRSHYIRPAQSVTSTPRLQPPHVFALQIRWNSSKDNVEPSVSQKLEGTLENFSEEEGQQTLENESIPNESREAQGKRQARFRLLDQQTRLLNEYDNNPPSETVYIGNIFYDITAEDLRKHFEQYGIVLKAMIVHDTRGLSKGFGYVQFNTVEEATRAIESQHMQMLEGRPVVVQYARSQIEHKKSNNAASNCLFIGNIPFEFTDRDMQELFRDIHNIIDVRVPVDRRSGVPRGFAHAEFLDIPSAARAMKILETKRPYDRKLRVNYSDRRRVFAKHYGQNLEANEEGGRE